jgi:carbon starvation protein CstA
MGFIDRAEFAVKFYLAHGIGIVVWLYFLPTVNPLVADFDGPFTPGWNLFEWAVPVYFMVALLSVTVWLVIGGVQREQARDQTRRVR